MRRQDMSTFEVKGKFRAEIVSNKWRPFTKVVESNNEKNAAEKVVSLMGSKHGLSRKLITIEEVSAIE
jgi:large subunit ribosomal protein LX